MKLRSRVVAIAAAAGLAAGLLMVGGAGTAHAQDTVLIDCDKVAGTGTAKPALTNTIPVAPVSVSFKNALTVGFPRTCTGDLAASAGPLTAFKGKVVGNIGCDSAATGPGTPYPANGKATNVYSVLGTNGKPVTSSLYIRLGAGETLDTFGVANGIVTKGVGVGADVTGSLLQNPTLKKPFLPDSTLGPDGTIISGLGSLLTGLSCQLGGGPLAVAAIEGALTGQEALCATATNLPKGTPVPFTCHDVAVAYSTSLISTLIFSTDGTSLVGPVVDSSVQLVFPDTTP